MVPDGREDAQVREPKIEARNTGYPLGGETNSKYEIRMTKTEGLPKVDGTQHDPLFYQIVSFIRF